MASKLQEGRFFVNPMQFFSRVEVILPFAFIALISTWATMDQAASWEAVITASMMIGIAIHHRAESTARKLDQNARTPGKNKHGKPNSPPSCAACVKPAESPASMLRDKAGVDIPPGREFSSVLVRKSVELTKLYSWLEKIEEAPHQADKGEAFVLSLLVRTTARLNDHRRLERTLQCMELCCVPISVSMYTELISRLGKRGDMRGATRWFERMTHAGLKGDVQTYSSLIHGCARLGNIEGAESWYEQMLSAGVAPTEVTFNSMMNVCARCGRPDLAEQWFHHMQETGMAPTVYTYNSVINALAKAELTEVAEHWLKDMIRRGLQPDIVSFSTIIHALTHQKGFCRVMQADRLLRSMLDRGFSCARQMPFNFRCVVQVCARGREMKLAEHWINMAEELGYDLGKYCYKFVACAYENLGMQSEAAVHRQRAGIDQCRPVSSSEDPGMDNQCAEKSVSSSKGTKALPYCSLPTL